LKLHTVCCRVRRKRHRLASNGSPENTDRGFETPVTLRPQPAMPKAIFIPGCGLKKAMWNSIESDAAVGELNAQSVSPRHFR
jgi:hypothetical protein